MRLVLISDTHSMIPVAPIPDGDVIICSGDISNRGSERDITSFGKWFSSLPHKHKIVIAGNHDFSFQNSSKDAVKWLCGNNKIVYLQDASVTLDSVKFYGSPWQPWFFDWAFNLPRDTGELGLKWNLIPSDTDVLITHGPPMGILDKCKSGERVGCEELLHEVTTRVNPKVHVFGHIHESSGTHATADTLFVNASTCTLQYNPINKPIVVDLIDGVAKHIEE